MRLLNNKLLMYNNISGVFYVLGAAGYITFISKYMEVQFEIAPQSGTIVVGPFSILGMVAGLIGSGMFIFKKKPSASMVLMWNVIVGFIAVIGQFSYIFLYCGHDIATFKDGNTNLTIPCNSNCSCEGVSYSPICHEASATTYFSACHAGCRAWDTEGKYYSNCSCLSADLGQNPFTSPSSTYKTLSLNTVNSLPKLSTFAPSTDSPIDLTTYTTDLNAANENEHLLSRSRRTLAALSDVLTPGVCQQGCQVAFWTFSIASMVVNWFGSSGRIGNILVNYRAVQAEDKSFAQGLTLMLISLFSLIPGPIIFGRIIDSTCLVWTETCSGKGNCQLYDQTSFRVYVNTLAFSLTLIGVLFDILVWYHGRNLDLYGDKEALQLEEIKRKDKPITPLLAKK